MIEECGLQQRLAGHRHRDERLPDVRRNAVLALLLEAENLLSGDADLATAKAQFERHEQFMIRMSS